MSTEEIKEAQDNEFEALQAIYFEDVLRDLRNPAWNIWHPLKFALTLTPQQGSATDANARVDLHVTCSERYPFEVPELNIKNEKGISQEQAQQLLKDLREEAKKHVGDVMVFELACYVQEFLYKHSKPENKSFYEEMMLRMKKQQLAEQEKRDQEKEIQAKKVKELQELHKQANKRYRDERRLSENSNSSAVMRKSFNDSSNESSNGIITEVYCEHEKRVIQFSNIEITTGQCLEHSSENCIFFLSMDDATGQIYQLSEWTVPNTEEKTNCDHVTKQISCIEQELKGLLRLKHPNLIHYVNMEHSILPDGKIVVNLLSEFIFGSNCYALYLSKQIPVELEMVRLISESVLSALDFLHRNNIVHKNLCASSIFISNRGHIKLANFSIYQRLTDLVSQSTNSNNYSKKIDIFDFGILVLSFIKGNLVDVDEIVIPYDVSMDLRDFIERCISKDEHRHTPSQLLDHSFLKAPTEKRSPIKRPQPPTDENNSSEIHPDDIKLLAQTNLNGKSRVETEFEQLDYIGKGAFGQVFKVRNKLDQRVYALKNIVLNSKNKLTNRKIIREVKLLSSLNHENVVRYYNSWIESATVTSQDSEDEDDGDYSEVDVSASPKKPRDKFMEKLVPNAKAIAWSISYGGKSSKNPEVVDDSDSSSSESSWSLGSGDSDSLVEFEADENEKSTRTSEEDDFVDEKCNTRQIQIMYIQMEFCDKSTLRTAIDNDLYKEKDRLWRLFREIIEGMTHIHQQGMIHRDLKPVNIFLDANDHVKIGDFGLATSNLLTKSEPIESQDKLGPSGDPYSLTGQIGTALYVAPELTSTAKATYNQKVDIYSLGIIFFEMSYHPCTTQNERIQVLTKLRTEKIIFPDDFDQNTAPVQKTIIKWLLDHKPANRPTSQELLQSDHMPPPVLEERELRDLLRHTLKNPQLKAYKYLVESCLNQPVSVVQDISYDKDMGSPFALKNLQVFNHVKSLLAKIFELHGAQELTTPLLMPKNKCYDSLESCVRLMTHSGSVVSIPYDLRIPFARYIAWNGITSLRRYSIAKVYREKRAFGFIPRELYECAFDIVTPTPGNLMADAEVIYLLDELAASVPGLRDRNRLIRLNHMSLLKAILLYCGIKDRHSEFYGILADVKEGKVTKMQVRTHLISSSVSNHNIATLFKFLSTEAPIAQIQNQLQTIIKRRNTEPGTLTKQALLDLQTIIDRATNLGVTSSIVINLGLIYNVPQYSAMMCQLAYSSYKKGKQTMEVLAAGGRYDETINSYKSLIHANKDVHQSAVGVSISLDRLVAIFLHHQQTEDGAQNGDFNVTHLDVVVGCTDKISTALKHVARILRDLRSAGIKATFVHGASQKEITEQGEELNVPYVIIWKDGQARVHHCKNPEKWEQYSLTTLVENFYPTETGMETSGTTLARSESTHRTHVQNSEANVNIVYLIFGEREKMAPSMKKRYEQLINGKMNDAFNKLNGDVTLFGLNVEGAMICTMASCFNFESKDEFQKSVDKLKEKYPKHKKYLEDLRDKINTHKTQNHSIILFSLLDNTYRVFL